MSGLILYELQGYPYCTKVKDKLPDLDPEYESRMVPNAHTERKEIEEISGQTDVPILVDEKHGVEGIPESNDIVDYLEETYDSAA